MREYDPLVAPDPTAWLAIDEGERQLLVERYHKRAGLRAPNDKLHAMVHVVVENQLAMGNATRAPQTAARLMSEGLDRHDAIHAIGCLVPELIHGTLSSKASPGADPTTAYNEALEKLTAASWLALADDEDGDEIEHQGRADPTLDLLAELNFAARMPVQAIMAARADKASAVPMFLRAIETRLAGDATNDGALFFIFHLLGEWRETSAYRPLVQFLRLPADTLDEILGDATFETAARVMAAVFDGDPRPLYDVILDSAANETARAAMMETLAVVTLHGQLPREDAARFLRDCVPALEREKGGYVWYGWQRAISLLGLEELRSLVKHAFEVGNIDNTILEYRHFDADMSIGPGESLADGGEHSLFGDTITELADWPLTTWDDDDELDDVFKPEPPAVNPFKKVGRNEPCPCGSGKKYKKCCLV